MTELGRGRHSSPDGSLPPTAGDAFGDPRYEPARYEVPPYVTGGVERAGRESSGAPRRAFGVLSPHAHAHDEDDRTGPLVEPGWWPSGPRDQPDHLPTARHRGGSPDPDGWATGGDQLPPGHPSAPLPPRPPGVWDKLQSRRSGTDDETVAAPPLPVTPLDMPRRGGQTPGPVAASRSSGDDRAEDATDAHVLHPEDGHAWEDETGGLDVIGAHVVEDVPRRRARRGRRGRAEPQEHREGLDEDALAHDPAFDEDIPVEPYDSRTGRARRRRRPVAVIGSLLVLAGIVVGIVLGGQKLIELVDPTAKDYTGPGTGEVSIRVQNGDTLSDIGRTLVEADVVAAVGPFVEAAESNAASVGIQPGVYEMRLQMSGQAALDRLLDPASRLLSRVTIPEGLTVDSVLARLAEETGRPVEEFQAAAADPAALGLPAYANGQLEGFLFPATYDVEPDDTPVDILRRMVQEFTAVAARLQLEQRAAAVGRTPLEIVTVASMIQSETRLDEERPDVGQVIYNRLSQGIPLGIDATLAYALDKNGNDLTVTDLRTDGPYNTRTRVGLPPTPISSPGEASLGAALAPTTGDLLYYVLESDDGRHFFTSDYAEFQAARQRCADAGLGCGG